MQSNHTVSCTDRVPVGGACVVSGVAYYRRPDSDGKKVFVTVAVSAESGEFCFQQVRQPRGGIFEKDLQVPVSENTAPTCPVIRNGYQDPLSSCVLSGDPDIIDGILHNKVKMRRC